MRAHGDLSVPEHSPQSFCRAFIWNTLILIWVNEPSGLMGRFHPFSLSFPLDVTLLCVFCGYIEHFFSVSAGLFFSLARTPGAAQYFVSTVAPVGSGTVRIIITAPQLKPISAAKSANTGSALHTGNERMIVVGSHFSGKKKSNSLFPANANLFRALFLSRCRNNTSWNSFVHTRNSVAQSFWWTAVPEALIASVLWAVATK